MTFSLASINSALPFLPTRMPNYRTKTFPLFSVQPILLSTIPSVAKG